MPEPILYEIKDRIAHITLNRPEALNALNRDLMRGWRTILADFNTNPEPLVGILRGAGDRAFSAGMDLKERASRDASGDRRRGGNPRGEMPPRPEKPMIAAIDGYCVAGGMELSGFCDIRIATAKSQFGQPEAKRSLIPRQAVQYLPRMVALGEAMYILLTGETISAERACQIGFIHKVVADADELTEEAQRTAEAVKLCAPLAVRSIKDIVQSGRNVPVEYSWRLGNAVQVTVDATEDAKEGPKAFAEKRPPEWKSR